MATIPSTPAPIMVYRDPQRWRIDNVQVQYDRQTDILYMHTLPMVSAGGIYLRPGDEMLVLVQGNGEVVGMQIENFRTVWLKTHPEVVPSFRAATRPILSHLMHTAWGNFSRIVVNSVTREASSIGPYPAHL